MSDGIPRYDLLKFDINYQLDKIGKFSKWFEQNLESQGAEALSKDKSGRPDDWVKLSEENIFDFYNTLPRLARNSLLTNLYSFVEYEIELLCKSCFEQYNDLKLSDFNYKGIERSRIYLLKVVKLTLPDFFKEDLDSGFLNIIRNSIVHNYGFVIENKRNKFDILKKKISEYGNEVQTDSVYRITLNKQFIPVVVKRTKIMFKELFSSIDNKLGIN